MCVEEQRAVLNWSWKNNAPLYLGPCAQIDQLARQIFGKSVSNITWQTPSWRETINLATGERILQQLATPIGPGELPIQTSGISATLSLTGALILTNSVALTPTAPTLSQDVVQVNQQFYGRGGFVAASRVDDTNCPGNYILGRVLNRAGGPIAGVRVVYVDQWGNAGEAVSKGGTDDFGRYDFPLGGTNGERDFYLTVVDSAGNPVSDTIAIHHAPAAGSACHNVVWQARE